LYADSGARSSRHKLADDLTRAHRLFKKAVQQGRNKRGGEAYFGSYVEPLRFTPYRIRHGTFVNAAELVRRQYLVRTPLADFFNSLLVSFHLSPGLLLFHHDKG